MYSGEFSKIYNLGSYKTCLLKSESGNDGKAEICGYKIFKTFLSYKNNVLQLFLKLIIA